MLLFNTLTQKKELFKPIEENRVRLYVCGITPYDTTHIGHAFLYMFFDVFVRYARYKGYKVDYVQNVTDIDDDILKRAKEEDKDWKALGEYWTKKFLDDYKALNMILPTQYVKATETMETIIEITQKLLDKGLAYEREGNVYFSIKKFKKYGELSKLNKKEMLELARERGGNPDDPNKKNPLDFILWRKSKESEPSWKSPWGAGRPGWHIECSAMNYKHLGPQIDIHGGGHDLIYPHHESEIAQTESFTGKSPFVTYWLHTAMVLSNGEKMSKSLGNMVFIDDLLKAYTANAIRWVLLSHHYRTPWQFKVGELEEAKQIFEQLADKLKEKDRGSFIDCEKFLDNDMDTPAALDYVISKMAGSTLKKTLRKLGFTF